MSVKVSAPSGSLPLTAATGHRWWVAASLLFIWSLGQVDKLGVSLLMPNPAFQKAMGIVGNPAAAGMLLSSFLVAYGIAIFFWGPFSQRVGVRNAALIGLAGWAICVIWFALAQSIGAAYWSRVVLGVAEAFLWPLSNALTARWFPVNERGRAQAIWINGTNIGPVIGFFILGGLLTGVGWRSAWFALAAVTILIGIPLIAFVCRDQPSQHKSVNAAEIELIRSGELTKTSLPGRDQAAKTATLAGSLRSGKAWLVTVAFIGNGFIFWGVAAWLPSFLASYKHFSPQAVGQLTSFAWILGLIAMVGVGYFSDKSLKRAKFGVAGWLLSALFLVLAAFSTTPVEGALCIGLALASIQMGTLTAQALIHSVVVESGISAAASWIDGLGNLLPAFMPVFIGMLVAATGNFMASFLFLAAWGVISAASGTWLLVMGY